MDELDKYPWSGHSVLVGHQNRPWQAKEEVLSFFGQRRAAARRAYRQFILEGIASEGEGKLAGNTLKGRKKKGSQEAAESFDSRVLGSGAFVEKLLAEEGRVIQERERLKRRKGDAEELLNRIGKEFGVSKEEMTGGGQRQIITKARLIFCYIASRRLGWSGKQLSEALHITPAAIHYAAVRGERLLRENGGLEEHLGYLTNLTTSP